MRLFKKSKKNQKSFEVQKMIDNNKKIEPIKVEFNISTYVYSLMNEVENNFDHFYSKVKHRKYIPGFVKTSINTYIANMCESYLQYQTLFLFFGKGSLREKKVKQKYEDMKKTCEKYNLPNKSLIEDKITNKGFEVDNVKSRYVEFFKGKNYIAKHVQDINSASFGDLLRATFNSLDIALIHADKAIEQLKKKVLDNTNKSYYAEIQGCISIVDQCLKNIDTLRKKFSVVISKIDFKFLRKHHSKDLSKINVKISNIQNELDVAYEQLQECYQVVLSVISHADDSVSSDSNKLAILLTSKTNYVCSCRKLLSTITKEDYEIGDLSDNINILEKYALNLGKIVKDKIKVEGSVLDYSKAVQPFKSDLSKLQQTINTSSEEMDALIGTANSAKAAIQYALSPMRKVEKVLDVVRSITGAAAKCRSAIGTVQGILDVLP